MAGVFSNVRNLRLGRSMFDLSYEKKLTCDMGQLIPIMCDEVVPGDTFEIANEVLIRLQPLVAPIMHEINVYTHYFFVPYRILWDDWEEFITGGPEGDSTVVLPRWTSPTTTVGSLWDYLGFPTGITPAAPFPIDFPRRAYNRVWNEYYRDETLQDEVSEDNQVILNRAWEKDYFTSSLPWRQRGTAPAIPLSGSGVAEFNMGLPYDVPVRIGDFTGSAYGNLQSQAISAGVTVTELQRNATGVAIPAGKPINAEINPSTFATWLASNSVDLTSITSFDVSDLRLAFQTQKWLERNARAGARYTEFLKAHFGVAPRDARLQRPEYIGGSKSPVIVSRYSRPVRLMPPPRRVIWPVTAFLPVVPMLVSTRQRSTAVSSGLCPSCLALRISRALIANGFARQSMISSFRSSSTSPSRRSSIRSCMPVLPRPQIAPYSAFRAGMMRCGLSAIRSAA